MNKKICKIILFLICILGMGMVWPFALIRTARPVATAMGTNYLIAEEAISTSEPLKQEFQAQTSRIETISFALDFADNASGELIFELLDSDKRTIYTINCLVSDMKPCVYFEVPIQKWVKKGEIYAYQIVASEGNSGQCYPVYTDGEETFAPGSVKLTVGDKEIDGQAVVSFLYAFPLGKKSTLCVGAFLLVVMLAGYSIIDQMGKRK